MRKKLLLLLLVTLLLAGCAANGAVPPATTEGAGDYTPQTFPGLGGKMPEMTFQTAEGETLTLSGLLEQKQLVVLNFWFADCPWCVREFPAIETAYQQHRDNVEVVALNPADSAAAVAAFQKQYELSFPMVACPRSWAVESGITAYPTSIFIDRDGVVCLIHRGAITAPEDWNRIFEAFTGDDYERTVYNSIQQLLG